MSVGDDVVRVLQQKLAVFGFTQPLPLAAYPLVNNMFAAFVKTTTSLKDSKLYVLDLLEQRDCWELGVEPYKCDNARLLAECSELHKKFMKESEKFEKILIENKNKMRALVNDKRHLEEHCHQLQTQITDLQLHRPSTPTKKGKRSPTKSTKPFISTVRGGGKFPELSAVPEKGRCSKCHPHRSSGPGTGTPPLDARLDQLEMKLLHVNDELTLYKRTVEAREKEIDRLNDLLSGGRPSKALAKDCCYKEVQSLTADNEVMRREVRELQAKIKDYQDKMHEAMQKALKTDEQLQKLRSAALHVEEQANKEVRSRSSEVERLRNEVAQLRAQGSATNLAAGEGDGEDDDEGDGDGTDRADLNERLNELRQRERELTEENKTLVRKLRRMKTKVCNLQKDLESEMAMKRESRDEDKIRLRTERDFFQREYLRLISKSGSEKEVEFLQAQVRSKDEELRILRTELCTRQECAAPTVYTTVANQTSAHSDCAQSQRSATTQSSASSNNRPLTSDCVQATILRAERERDCALAELERVRLERDTVREKHLSERQLRHEESEQHNEQTVELREHIRDLERENRILTSARLPGDTQIVLLKEELDRLKHRLHALQEENANMKLSYGQLKILNESTERSLRDYQSKLALAEGRAEAAELRVSAADSSRESNQRELQKLRTTVESLTRTYVDMEHEKDALLAQLDSKSEQFTKCEHELKLCREKRKTLEAQVKEMEEELENLKAESRERGSILNETSTQTKHLRQQIAALKCSRDKAIAENAQLSNDLADSRAEILTLNKKLHDAEAEVNRLKQQLREYVKEVKKAEDLLMQKEKEREEMLEHYRSLSQDACMLEGNNQSLEVEAAEYKRQLNELETEIDTLKKQLCCRNNFIQQLEDKIIALTTQTTCLEHQLEEAHDEQRLLKVDLAARKELCDKLDIEKEKLNAELHELNRIRGKLERENEQMRSDLERNQSGTKVCSDTLEELLAKTRQDLEEQIKMDSELSQQCVRLRQQNENLMSDLNNERMRREQNETLAREFQVQNQELRHNLTDDRFRQARSREQSPRYPTQTL